MKAKPIHEKLKNILAFTTSLLLMLFLYPFSITLAEGPWVNPSEYVLESTPDPNITFYAGSSAQNSGDTNGPDVLRAYKIITITYNTRTNTLSHAFTTHFQNFLNSISSALTVEEYLTLGNSEFISLLRNYQIYANTVEGESYNSNPNNADYWQKNTNADINTTDPPLGYAKFDNMKMGQYLVIGIGNSLGPRVYSFATANLQPTVPTTGINFNRYVVNNVYQIDIKAEDGPSIEKKISTTPSTPYVWNDLESAHINETLHYQVTTQVPTYHSNTNTDNVLFKVEDILPNSIDYIADSISVKIGETKLINDTDIYYTSSYSSTDHILTINFTYSNIKNYANQNLVITYNAQLNSSAVIGGTGNTNTATLSYSVNPNVTNTPPYTVSDSTTVYTYGIAVNKFDDVNNSTRLTNAKFKIYTDSDATQNPITSNDYDIITDANGFGTYIGLKAGTYYLKETSAPTGYKLIGTNPIIIVVPNGHTSDLTLNSNPITTLSTTTTSNDTITWGDNSYTATGDNVTLLSSMFNAYSNTNGFSWVNIANTQGSRLPSTGGIGTTIFTVIGIILIVGAIILLITKARMTNKKHQ